MKNFMNAVKTFVVNQPVLVKIGAIAFGAIAATVVVAIATKNAMSDDETGEAEEQQPTLL